jgi:long-chain acyl-CoA synthetase
VTADVADTPLAGVQQQVDLDSPAADALLAEAPDPFAVPVAERAPHDTAWLFYTSGTTGRPKGVMLTGRNLMTMGLGYHVDVDPVAPGDAIAYAAPISHGAGLYAIPHLMAGARHVVPASGGFDAAELFALGRAVGPLSLFAAPTIVGRLVDHAQQEGLSPADCARAFKTIVYGGAPMYLADIQRALRVMGPRFVQIYGQGETPMVGTVLARADLADTRHPRHLQRLASIGTAQTPVRVRVTDANGRDLPGRYRRGAGPGRQRDGRLLEQPRGHGRGHPRRLALHRRHGRAGRRRLPDAERPQQGPDHQRRQQHLPARGRGALLTAPGVLEVAVVGEHDAQWGENVVAFIVAAGPAAPDEAALDAHCLQQIARFKRPKRYIFVSELPKNNYGKVLKTALRERLRAQG